MIIIAASHQRGLQPVGLILHEGAVPGAVLPPLSAELTEPTRIRCALPEPPFAGGFECLVSCFQLEITSSLGQML